MIFETGAIASAGVIAFTKYMHNKKVREGKITPPTMTPVSVDVKVKVDLPIPFKPGEPQTFQEFAAQPQTLGILEDAIGALEQNELSVSPQMFAGSAGGGKTLLAKVLASELRTRNGVSKFIEAMDVKTEEALDAIMLQAMQSPGSVIFFDEIHVLAGYTHLIKLYLALDEGRYHFAGEEAPRQLPPTTFVSATTDSGKLPEAFKRRWVTHFFEPYSREQLGRIIKSRGIPVYDDAAELILSRTSFAGAPWEAVQLLELANNARKARRGKKINKKDVKRVFRLFQIDKNGLRRIDRNAIAALFKLIKRKVDGEMRYAGSEENVALMAKIDRDEFKTSVRPRLISRGLLELRPWWGHCLTDKAVSMYSNLRED